MDEIGLFNHALFNNLHIHCELHCKNVSVDRLRAAGARRVDRYRVAQVWISASLVPAKPMEQHRNTVCPQRYEGRSPSRGCVRLESCILESPEDFDFVSCAVFYPPNKVSVCIFSACRWLKRRIRFSYIHQPTPFLNPMAESTSGRLRAIFLADRVCAHNLFLQRHAFANIRGDGIIWIDLEFALWWSELT